MFVDLHSNMDRFESASYSLYNSPIACIYIPIWIDLKDVLTYIDVNTSSYLHSNMDRFESEPSILLLVLIS